jgi:hypothetical protein
MKGQVSNELLVVVGFILLLLIPLLYMMYFRMDTIRADLSVLQVHFSVARLAFLVNAIGYMGDGSAMIAELYIPDNVDSVVLEGNEVVFSLREHGVENDVVGPTAFSMEFDEDAKPILDEGPGAGSRKYRIEIFNQGGLIVLSPQPAPSQT